MGFWVAEVIGDPVIKIVSMMIEIVIMMEMMTEMIPHNNNIKVVQDEKAREEEPSAKERIGNPCV